MASTRTRSSSGPSRQSRASSDRPVAVAVLGRLIARDQRVKSAQRRSESHGGMLRAGRFLETQRLMEVDMAATEKDVKAGCSRRKSTRLNSSHLGISYAV